MMNANDRLIEILATMKTFNDEDDHQDADALLCETITILAQRLHGEAETIAHDIVSAYNAETFHKWYA